MFNTNISRISFSLASIFAVIFVASNVFAQSDSIQIGRTGAGNSLRIVSADYLLLDANSNCTVRTDYVIAKIQRTEPNQQNTFLKSFSASANGGIETFYFESGLESRFSANDRRLFLRLISVGKILKVGFAQCRSENQTASFVVSLEETSGGTGGTITTTTPIETQNPRSTTPPNSPPSTTPPPDDKTVPTTKGNANARCAPIPLRIPANFRPATNARLNVINSFLSFINSRDLIMKKKGSVPESQIAALRVQSMENMNLSNTDEDWVRYVALSKELFAALNSLFEKAERISRTNDLSNAAGSVVIDSEDNPLIALGIAAVMAKADGESNVTLKNIFIPAMVSAGFSHDDEMDFLLARLSQKYIYNFYEPIRQSPLKIVPSNAPSENNGGCYGSVGETKFPIKTQAKPNVTICKGDKVRLTASGLIVVGPFLGASAPDGIDAPEIYNYETTAKHGSLLVRIVSASGTSKWATVGFLNEFIAPKSGKLEFLVNDRDPSNNQGQYEVVVKVACPPRYSK